MDFHEIRCLGILLKFVDFGLVYYFGQDQEGVTGALRENFHTFLGVLTPE
jgi:hypothetical protein